MFCELMMSALLKALKKGQTNVSEDEIKNLVSEAAVEKAEELVAILSEYPEDEITEVLKEFISISLLERTVTEILASKKESQITIAVSETDMKKVKNMLTHSSVPGFRTAPNGDGSFSISPAY